MTIYYGFRKVQVFSTGPKSTHKEIRGYYLVLPNADRHWLGLGVYDAARTLQKACDKYLSAKNGYEYWIDYCMGLDVDGNLAWANMDQTDVLLDFLGVW